MDTSMKNLSKHLLLSIMALSLLSACDTTQGSTAASPSQSMQAFNGTIFVASTELVYDLWKIAGWQISNTPLDTDNQNIPLDCTLYPHEGVTNQWIGGCSGQILIPSGGAKHIAVMITHDDGSTIVVQVAPPPSNSNH
jgi:hypothetical protein